MKQQFLVDTADTFRAHVYENNQILTPTSATLTVYNPGTSTKLIDGAAMTIAADGQLTYSLTATHTDVVGESYKAVIAYVISDTTYYLTLFFDVVRSKLHKVITDDDLEAELPQLAQDKGGIFYGDMTGGSTTTIVDAELKRFPDDYFTGGQATNLTNEETRLITDFVSASGTVTTAAFATANAATNKYSLRRSFTREIQRAFEKIENLLEQSGKRSALVLDSYDLREVHILYAVAEVCKGRITDNDSIWYALWHDYDKRAYAVFKSTEFKYDTSDDGYITSTGEGNARIERTIVRG
jgi:hypothetical protein